jgi:hypothetical protein
MRLNDFKGPRGGQRSVINLMTILGMSSKQQSPHGRPGSGMEIITLKGLHFKQMTVRVPFARAPSGHIVQMADHPSGASYFIYPDGITDEHR